jgi:hypothetical protein
MGELSPKFQKWRMTAPRRSEEKSRMRIDSPPSFVVSGETAKLAVSGSKAR